MADETICKRHERAHSTVWLKSKSSIGLDLGELRQAVAAAEGMPDSANVYVEGVTQSATYISRRWVRELHIESSVKAAEQEPAPDSEEAT